MKVKDPNKKLIIVSDIKSQKPGVIPFGLNLAKYLHLKVDILHTVDSRSQHGVPSRYADSQTLAPASKLSHEEIIEREKNHAGAELETLLSKEASRLNFPLRIEIRVRGGAILEGLQKLTKNKPESLVIINSQADGYIFNSQKEIIETVSNISAIPLLVPANMLFTPIKNVVMVTDFSNGLGVNTFSNVNAILEQFKPQINAVEVVDPSRYNEKIVKSKKWKQKFESEIDETVNTEVIKSTKPSRSLQQYFFTLPPDLVVFTTQKMGFLKRWFGKSLVESFLKDSQYPTVYLA
jgi:hypothetical protein